MKRLIPVLLLSLLPLLSAAQQKWPVIKATSTTVDIRDGKEFRKGQWEIMPEVRPDVYTTSNKRVTFYTDKDSIAFKIKPKIGTYDFVVLLNGKDSAYTQIKYVKHPITYLEKLKKAKKYNFSEKRDIPAYTYESADNKLLKTLREKYNLDSIAGQGAELSKILNLMYWVHNKVRHDGMSYNPEEKNADALIEICKKENRGINCRMLAIVLNECYLAMGIKSNFITCMPKETEFDDCHVINSVYSSDLKKWIWIDPTFAAYVMNEKGELQSIEEVRRKLISGAPLILNPEANWNNESTQTKEHYLYTYMAKNLYRFSAPLFSRPNAETWVNTDLYPEYADIELLPLDGLEQTPKESRKDIKNEDGSFRYKISDYKTNNPEIFWALPK